MKVDLMGVDVIRAWKDEAYRQQLSHEKQAMLPANPAGEMELNDAELETVYGAQGYVNTNALACVQSLLVYCITINGNCGNA
jgi:mersacidin/lichenicidin family type 2 lantibiotic